jgi:hypothetical protein
MKTYPLFIFRAIAIAILFSVTAFNAGAQSFVFHAEFVNAWSGPGFNFVNDINGYPSVTVQASSTDDEFIIEADNYYNKWDNYGTCTVNVATPFVFYGNTPSFDPGNSYLTDSTFVGKFYTARIKNVGYLSTNVIIMETDSAPVVFGSVVPVSQTPAANAVAANTPVDVMVTIDQAKSMQERVYIRYTTDNWATSQATEVVFANAGDIVGHATLPAQAAGVTVNYYAFTTTVDVTLGVGDYDLITLKQETNAGANYQYTVMMPPVGTAQITFQVNMSTQTVGTGVFLAGSFNGFSTTANPMNSIGNGIYTATITVDTNVVLQYKFVNGTTYETGNSACGIDDGNGGYNRNYVVPEVDDTIAIVCFNECSNCILPTFSDVTFRVNMSNQTVSPLGVFLAGSFNGFSATADSMIAVGNGVYEKTMSLDTTLSVQYKFVNGSTYEAGNAACGVDDLLGGYNRVYNVLGTNSVLPTVCFNECANCYVPTFSDVTFSVNMSNQTVSPLGVFLAGSFNGFSATADSMIAVGNGVYEKTMSLDTTLSVQYKFVNGSTYEAGNAACGVDDLLGGYNRVYNVLGTNSVLPTVCFNECANCYVPTFSDVTFSVNMSNQTVSPLGVFLAGSFNGFSATADSMIAVGNGVYEKTMSLDTTLSVQYKFVNGSTYEAGNAACGVDDLLGGYNRVYNVLGTNSVLPTVCFNECANCYVPTFSDVTFSVNMSNQTVSPLGVFLAGSFNGFSATADSMIDVGNGVYEKTMSLDTTLSVQYKFVNGSTYEAGNAACGVDDLLGGYNRVYNVLGTNSVLPTVCFNECANCLPVGLNAVNANEIAIYPIPSKSTLFVKTDNFDKQLKYEIINQMGAHLGEGNIISNLSTINVADLASGYYFISFRSSQGVITKSFVKE